MDLWTCGLVDLWTCGLVDKSTCRLVDNFALWLLEKLPVEDGIRVLWALDPDVPKVVLDAWNETMLQGVVV